MQSYGAISVQCSSVRIALASVRKGASDEVING